MLTQRATDPLRSLRVVVLGARGFVGRYLLEQLAALDIPAVGVSSTDVDLCAAGSADALRRIIRPDDSLVFASALTPDKGKDVHTLMRNLAMGEHVSTALAVSPCAHVVYLSSDAVYDDAANPVGEDSCCSPSSFHGLMHLVRERMLEQTLQAQDVPLAILRPSALYGVGDTHNSYGPNRFLRTAVQERVITLVGNGEEKRDHVYIEDLARLVCFCVERRSEGVLNVATGSAHSFFEVAQVICELCGDDVRLECLPRTNPIRHRHFDVTERLRAFPSFRPTSLREGLARTFGAMKDRRAS